MNEFHSKKVSGSKLMYVIIEIVYVPIKFKYMLIQFISRSFYYHAHIYSIITYCWIYFIILNLLNIYSHFYSFLFSFLFFFILFYSSFYSVLFLFLFLFILDFSSILKMKKKMGENSFCTHNIPSGKDMSSVKVKINISKRIDY